MQRAFLTIGDRQLHYRVAGDGPPVVMLHPSPMSSAALLPMATALAAHFRVYAFDTPGYGLSDPLPDRPLYSVAPGWRARSIQFGTWKVIATGEGAQRTNELYNLATDPGEMNNLAASQPAKLAELLRLLDQAAARDRDSLPKE